jgi:hypothetical protein
VGNSVLRVVLFSALLEVVSSNLKHLKFVAKTTQVLDAFVQVAQAVLADGKHVEVSKFFEAANRLNVVGVKAEIGDLGARIEALNHLDGVEAQIEPLEVDERFEVANFTNDVVVELKLGELLHAEKVVNSNDV